jgi:hypothetical protein
MRVPNRLSAEVASHCAVKRYMTPDGYVPWVMVIEVYVSSWAQGRPDSRTQQWEDIMMTRMVKKIRPFPGGAGQNDFLRTLYEHAKKSKNYDPRQP